MSFRLWCNSIKLWVVAGSNKERDIRGAIRELFCAQGLARTFVLALFDIPFRSDLIPRLIMALPGARRDDLPAQILREPGRLKEM